MKKIILLFFALILSIACFSQNEQKDSLQLKTYKQNYSYFKKEKFDSLSFVYDYTSSFTVKYANFTPGQLIEKSGKLKNAALTVGILTGLASATLVGCSFLTDKSMAMYIPGAIVGFAGGVATLVILYTSNKLLQEAGLKMQRMQLSANGVILKF